ncbi:MAG: hypothetical protein HN976_31695 [Lentisphaerae bacterium]|jgi:nucleoside 2-deoxyribosyltransferase|nr:hypothetical protein [Lentisphaerota bacterium]MBT7059704.1 hypothetical protein [Lentisphaerota bacterium]
MARAPKKTAAAKAKPRPEAEAQGKKPTCFIIMPISTPADKVEQYSGDADHFEHVLCELFVPAVEQAGFEAISPLAGGAEVIQAWIIEQLEKADLVLCDISILNPNVFFELGIRTALNKPVCYVKDSLTEKIPFDTSSLSHADYNPDLSAWIVKDEIPKLVSHIEKSVETEAEGNSMWKVFGMSIVGKPAGGDADTNDYLQMILRRIDGLGVEHSRGRGRDRAALESNDGYVQALMMDLKLDHLITSCLRFIDHGGGKRMAEIQIHPLSMDAYNENRASIWGRLGQTAEASREPVALVMSDGEGKGMLLALADARGQVYDGNVAKLPSDLW